MTRPVPWIGTSLKMNKTRAEARAFASTLADSPFASAAGAQPFVIPPFPSIAEVAQILSGTAVKVGAQNMHWDDRGAWTGEVSPLMLKDCGLAASRKEGLQVFYRLAVPEVTMAVAAVRRIAEQQLAEVSRIVREYFESRDALQPVRREELLKMARRGEAVVIDVRPAEEYAAGHIAGAINMPVDSLPRFLKKLPKEQEIVAYCRGPYCMLAFEAVEKLRKKGFRARRLEDGFPEWQAGRLPVAVSAGGGNRDD